MICRSWPAVARILTSACRPCPLLTLPLASPQGGSTPRLRRSRHRLRRCSKSTKRDNSSSSILKNMPGTLSVLPPAPQATCLATRPEALSTTATPLAAPFKCKASSRLLLPPLLPPPPAPPRPPPLLPPPSPPSPPWRPLPFSDRLTRSIERWKSERERTQEYSLGRPPFSTTTPPRHRTNTSTRPPKLIVSLLTWRQLHRFCVAMSA